MRFTGQQTAYFERYLECDYCGHKQTDKTRREVPHIPCDECGETGRKKEGFENE